MRSSSGQFLLESNKLIGFSFGAGYCAEHECGIDKIHVAFGAPFQDTSIMGLRRRTATSIPTDKVYLWDTKKKTVLVFDHHPYHRLDDKHPWQEYIKRARFGSMDGNVSCAWDSGSFGIWAEKEDEKEHLRQLYYAILSRDIAFWVHGVSNPFDRGGLVMCIASKLPKKHMDAMQASDEDVAKLNARVDEIKIIPRLRTAKKNWYALAPAWRTIKSTNRGEMTSAYDVMFFLNPTDQHLNNHGWFTVEDLGAWINNTGPIPKKPQ